ncbi:MAG TPA: carbamoyltransferase [Verrucomicrobiae bacterium]|nr:carbamoyltransferase [Verrucomicrobiae bacterium]
MTEAAASRREAPGRAARRYILGISAYYHDSAAALLRGGHIVAAAQQERFSRRKNDERFPLQAVEFCLRFAGIGPADLDAVVFYDKPITKFARLLESYLAVAPGGWLTFPRVLPAWLSEKLNLPKTIRAEIPGLGAECPILFTQHHQAHAASAFLPSPFERAAVLTIDGVGEWATTTIGRGRGIELEVLRELLFPHSLGLLYSAFTAYCGFQINSGEYKLMGLAPYGEPRFVQAIAEHLIDVKADGSFWLNMEYFEFLRGFTMVNQRFHQLLGGPPRLPEAPLEQRHLDVARSIQVVTEDIILKLARQARALTGERHLCMAGGVALNCVANGRILREGIFERIWIQPAAGDAGGALGAALAAAAPEFGRPHHREFSAHTSVPETDAMQGALLGPGFSAAEVQDVLRKHDAVYEQLTEESLFRRVAELLSQGKVIGWVQGRMEFGPRALGNRSILADPRSPVMQSILNLKVKFRESFRPFAPVVRRERVQDYFDLTTDSPYMLMVAPVQESLRRSVQGGSGVGVGENAGVSAAVSGAPDPSGRVSTGYPDLVARVREQRSTLPAVTHVDYSARIQTVTRAQNPRLYGLLEEWERTTGCGVLVNTSFNVRGEPIVCTPEDAYRCFVNTEMDFLVLGDFLLDRLAQPRQGLAPKFEAVPD